MMSFSKKFCGVAGAGALSLFAALPAWAQEAAAAAPTPGKGDTAWMMMSTDPTTISRTFFCGSE